MGTLAITMTSKDGNVKLAGTTDSWQQKALVTEVAKTVSGVKAIENLITVHSAVARPHAEITTDGKRRIANDVWLDATTFTVSVSGHTVDLVSPPLRARSTLGAR
jgi:hypothetical protein